ncbi:hypothetical protein J4V69_14810, partial [Escherichia coli]
AHQPNRRLRLAAEPQTGRREVSALTDARKTLAYDFFRILRAPHHQKYGDSVHVAFPVPSDAFSFLTGKNRQH